MPTPHGGLSPMGLFDPIDDKRHVLRWNVLCQSMSEIEYPAWMPAEKGNVLFEVTGYDRFGRVQQTWIHVALQAHGGMEQGAGLVEGCLPVYADGIADIGSDHRQTGTNAFGKENGGHS